MTPLVLASASPRRAEILRTLGLDFTVRPSDTPEHLREGEGPREMAARLAREKAASVARDGELVLGADTVVIVDEAALGKPEDEAHALEMLRQLSGRWHSVRTAVALAGVADVALAVETRVRFGALDDETMRRYVATGEGVDKAGGYAIQGLGAGLVEGIEGSYSNVVGLPAREVVEALRGGGWLGAWP